MDTATEITALELPLGNAVETFSLEKAVCSHGLFMMPPNKWDPLTRTFSRPLRRTALLDVGCDDESSVMVRISHPLNSLSLQVLVYGNSPLSLEDRESLLYQVRRMLRLSEVDEMNVREFQRICQKMEASQCIRDFGGRVFRSPTLFEDMVKCILLCNCQWSRTLSMARALCELQFELQHDSSSLADLEICSKISETPGADREDFIPKTPALKESKRKLSSAKARVSLLDKFSDMRQESEVEVNSLVEGDEDKKDAVCEKFSVHFSSPNVESSNYQTCQNPNTASETDLPAELGQYSVAEESNFTDKIGNFPSPKELANLDERFLAKRCNLGYRAGRVLKLSRDIVEGKIKLRQLQEACDTENLTSYSELMEQLKEIDGFGPFTCANVLMCMGFFHVIPTDSETVRHLKQVHAKGSSIQSIQRDLESIYGKYEPFQFLAYWAEIWNFYEQTFGKLSAMPYSDYKLITASNMKTKGSRRNKKAKLR